MTVSKLNQCSEIQKKKISELFELLPQLNINFFEEKHDYKKEAVNKVKNVANDFGEGYDVLSSLLKDIGVKKSHTELQDKINSGTFSFAFVLQIADALNLDVCFKVKPTNFKNPKDVFVSMMYEIDKVFDSTDDDNICKILEGAKKELFYKVGFDKFIYNMYIDLMLDDESYKEPNRETFERMYDELQKENKSAARARELFIEIESL